MKYLFDIQQGDGSVISGVLPRRITVSLFDFRRKCFTKHVFTHDARPFATLRPGGRIFSQKSKSRQLMHSQTGSLKDMGASTWMYLHVHVTPRNAGTVLLKFQNVT